jgi:hypothetical protein
MAAGDTSVGFYPDKGGSGVGRVFYARHVEATIMSQTGRAGFPRVIYGGKNRRLPRSQGVSPKSGPAQTPVDKVASTSRMLSFCT